MATPAVGTPVVLHSLVARPDLNGRKGAVVAYSADKGRYTVEVQGETLALKPDNLKVLDEAPAAAKTAVGVDLQ